MIYYKILKIWLFSINFLTDVAFVYTVINLQTKDKLIMAIVFLLCLGVTVYLIRYYGNAIIKISFDDNQVKFLMANNKIKMKSVNDYLSMENTDVRVILHFKDGSYFYIVKQYGFKKNKLAYFVIEHDINNFFSH